MQIGGGIFLHVALFDVRTTYHVPRTTSHLVTKYVFPGQNCEKNPSGQHY